MNQPEFEAIFYDLPDGSEPVIDFINAQSTKMAAKILWTIDLLEDKGVSLRLPYSEHLDDGIFELRIELGSDITRVLYFFMVGKKASLTNGFVKKTKKTPQGEFERAKKYRAEYMNRPENRKEE